MKRVPQQLVAFVAIVLCLTIWGSVRHEILEARNTRAPFRPAATVRTAEPLAPAPQSRPPSGEHFRIEPESRHEWRSESRHRPLESSRHRTHPKMLAEPAPALSPPANRDADTTSANVSLRQLPRMPHSTPVRGAVVLHQTGMAGIPEGQGARPASDTARELRNDADAVDSRAVASQLWTSDQPASSPSASNQPRLYPSDSIPAVSLVGTESSPRGDRAPNAPDQHAIARSPGAMSTGTRDLVPFSERARFESPLPPDANGSIAFSSHVAEPPAEERSGIDGDKTVVSIPDAYPLEPLDGASPIVSSATSFAPSSLTPPSSMAGVERTSADVPGPAVARGLGDPTHFRLAAAPDPSRMERHQPVVDPAAIPVPVPESDFSDDPIDTAMPDDPLAAIQVYEGKRLNATQRPLVEWGRRWYDLGQLPQPSTLAGFHNPITPQFIVFGDLRTAVAANRQNGDSQSLWAWELNLNMNLQLTGTERLAAGIAPLDNGAQNTRLDFEGNDFVDIVDADFDFGFFEGDLGAIVGGWTGETLPFDMPFAIGVMPMLVQNGVWMEDNFLGAAVTIPARNVPGLGISNMDVTFLAGFDEILSPAFENNDDVAKLYGMLSFIEAWNGYLEFDYAYLEDRDSVRDRSYHNIGIGFTRRYGRWVSNSTRVIVNAGQSTVGGPNTADGVLLLSENSLITRYPSTVVPYFNLFAGFDRPQAAARNGNAGGVLRNTGILFESDGMTGYPTLDATANDTFGAALGLNLLAGDFSQQLIVEAAVVGVMGDVFDRNAAGSQFGIGFRHQLPISNSVIIRTDGMLGFLKNTDDISGLRIELRHKF